MREIKLSSPKERRTPTDKNCPACGSPLTHGIVPCPEGRPGCLVIHLGYLCSSCGKYWQEGNENE